MNIRNLVAVAALLVPSVLAAPVASAQTGDAQVRIAHFSPDSPAVDVYVDGKKVSNNVPYEKASNYLALPAGTHTVEVRTTGSAADVPAAIKATVDVAAGKAYTVAAIGKAAQLQGKVYQDDNTPPPAGKVKLRIIHDAPDVGAVDVAVKNGPVLVSKLAFPDASAYLPLDPGSYEVEVRTAGSTTVLLASTVVLQPGGVYTVAAIGGADKPPKLRGLIDVPATAAITSTTGAAGSATTVAATTPSTAAATTAAPTTAAATTAAPTTAATAETTAPTETTAAAAETTVAPTETTVAETTVPDTTAAPDTTVATPDTTTPTPVGGVASGGGGLSGGTGALGILTLGGAGAAALALALQRRRRFGR